MIFFKPLFHIVTQIPCEIEHLVSFHIRNDSNPFISSDIPLLSKTVELVNNVFAGSDGIGEGLDSSVVVCFLCCSIA